MAKKFDTIKEAVLANHGGFDTATQAQIQSKWNSLPLDVQKSYLEKLKLSKQK